MTLTEYNNKIEALGKELFKDGYRFTSTQVNTIIFGAPTYNREVKYTAAIFYGHIGRETANISAESKDINEVEEILRFKYRSLNTQPTKEDIEIS